MTLTGIHFLLTYTCNFECDHCFLYCSPKTEGTFTLNKVEAVLNEARRMGTVEWIFYEGGEPFLYFPLLNESVRLARERGFKVGVVTNAYGAISSRDAELWIKPLVESGLTFLNVSNDTFHYGEEKETPALTAHAVAEKLGIRVSPICIARPQNAASESRSQGKGQPVVGGEVRFRG